jgi:hypothetical protein
MPSSVRISALRSLDQESMRLHKLRYKESLSKKVFLELLRDNAKVTHEDNERIRK